MTRRSPAAWGALGAVLARALTVEPPAWVSEATREAVALALAGYVRDARTALVGRSTRAAPGVLGLARSAYQRALADGWLSE